MRRARWPRPGGALLLLPDIDITIELTGGKGTVEGRVQEHAMAWLEFEAETDQSFLNQTLTELRAVTAQYPFRH